MNVNYKGYEICVDNKTHKFKVTNDDLEGTERESYQQLVEYIDRTVAGKGKIKRDKIALKVFVPAERWGNSEFKEGVVTGIHMGTGQLLGVKAYKVYPHIEKIRALVADIVSLEKQLMNKRDALSRYEISADRKGSFRQMEPENYDKYIKALIDEYENKVAL